MSQPEKLGEQISFRPTKKNRDVIAKLRNANVNISESINAVLEKHLQQHAQASLKAKLQQLQEALN